MGRVRCGVCDTTLESKHRHDFVGCGCSNRTFVDGGNDYLRYGGMDMTQIFVVRDDGEEYNISRMQQEQQKDEPNDE